MIATAWSGRRRAFSSQGEESCRMGSCNSSVGCWSERLRSQTRDFADHRQHHVVSKAWREFLTLTCFQEVSVKFITIWSRLCVGSPGRKALGQLSGLSLVWVSGELVLPAVSVEGGPQLSVRAVTPQHVLLIAQSTLVVCTGCSVISKTLPVSAFQRLGHAVRYALHFVRVLQFWIQVFFFV